MLNVSRILLDGGIITVIMSTFLLGILRYNQRLFLNKGKDYGSHLRAHARGTMWMVSFALLMAGLTLAIRGSAVTSQESVSPFALRQRRASISLPLKQVFEPVFLYTPATNGGGLFTEADGRLQFYFIEIHQVMIQGLFGIDFNHGPAGFFHVELANPFGFVFVPSFRGFNRTLDPFLIHL